MYRVLLAFVLVSIFFPVTTDAQEEDSSGRVLKVSGKTVDAHFDNADISIGDEVEIYRIREIVDPVSGKLRGEQVITIATGVIGDFGIGKASIMIIKDKNSKKVKIGDMVVLSGKEKQIKNREKSVDIKPIKFEMYETPQLKYGEIQEITDDTIVTNLGTEDEISEGDSFLIQRTEPEYDPGTHEITGTSEINVGKLIVVSVTDTSSVARIVEKKMEPKITDRVVKESEYLKYLASVHSDSAKIDRLQKEVKKLKQEIAIIKSTLDSIGYERNRHENEFFAFKKDIETVLSQLMTSDINGLKININNDEPIIRNNAANLFELYKYALDNCLEHNLQSAIEEFKYIVKSFPDSKLTENCHYWIAQSYFGMKEYPRAITWFNAVIDDKRFNHKDDDASIMLGITYYKLNEPDKSLVEFQKFILNYTGSEYRRKVNYWIKRLSS